MGKTSLLGIICIVAAVYFGAIDALPTQDAVFNKNALILIFGGTISAFLISFPVERLSKILNLLIKKRFKGEKLDQKAHLARELIVLSDLNHNNEDFSQLDNLSHPFLKEALQLLQDKSVSKEDLKYILWKRSEVFYAKNQKDHKTLLALAKFPPAFGLLGSVTGIIAMLMNLGVAGKEVIGQGMAIALLTTFWGVAITNMFILPLADFVDRAGEEDSDLRELITEGVLELKSKSHPSVFSKKIYSFLSPSERSKLNTAKIQSDENNIYHIRFEKMKDQDYGT